MGETVYVGMGSNWSDREDQLLAARAALSQMEGVRLLRCSSLYDSAPIGPNQPRFLNAVAELSCSLPPKALLSALQKIEQAQGRVRGQRWGPRSIDLDILLWEGQQISDPELVVPHPHLHTRRFALEPLAELKESVGELLKKVLDQDVKKWNSSRWPER